MSGLLAQMPGTAKEQGILSQKKIQTKKATVVKVNVVIVLFSFQLLQFRTAEVLPLHTDAGDVACCLGERDWSSFLILISFSVLRCDTE